MLVNNTPNVKMALVGVSRDCFQIELCRHRLEELTRECKLLGLDPYVCEQIIESETDAAKAAVMVNDAKANAVTVLFGNFGPEMPTAIFSERVGVPVQLVGSAEESKAVLAEKRGDSFCGLLNAMIAHGFRGLMPFVPERPIGLPKELAKLVLEFVPVARVVLGVKGLKVIAYGPRPQDFYACNAPIKPLYDLGVEVMENSELDLVELFLSMKDHRDEILAIKAEMEAELGEGNKHPEKLMLLAQFELALKTSFNKNLGASKFAVFADKCWPAFEKAFGFVPCYVNGRMAAQGIPGACEVDIYGAVSEYMVQCAAMAPATIKDINNTVPEDIPIADLKGVDRSDLWMAFHCGNSAKCLLCDGCAMKFQLIMNRLMEKGGTPDITVGTLEGTLRPGPTTIFRLQPELNRGSLRSYIAQGNILDADPSSFGAIGIVGIKDFWRFYRHVLLEKQFPHHTAMVLNHVGRTLFAACKMLGITDINYPLPASVLYPTENPFSA